MGFEALLGYGTGLYLLDVGMSFPDLVGTALFVHLLDGAACGVIAARDGRVVWRWVAGGGAFGVWALLTLLVLIARGRSDSLT